MNTGFVSAPLASRLVKSPGSRGSGASSSSRVPRMAAVGTPPTSYTGGLDRLSSAPYEITRYLFKDRPVVTLDEESSKTDRDVLISRAYRHLFGNAYIMEEERAELSVAESQYKAGNISARDFVRAVAHSEAYKSRFFDTHSQFRFIELNFKHLLGRAPTDQLELSTHYQIFAQEGYYAEIDSYIDSDEYLDVFGLDTMPYTRFRGTYAPNSTFNMQCKLEGGWARSDKKLKTPAWFTPTTSAQVSNGLPPIQNAEHPSKFAELPVASLERYRNELEIANAKLGGLQSELDQAYEALESAKDFLAPYMNMVSSSEITPVFGTTYGEQGVEVFSGQYLGAAKGDWGVNGVEKVGGRTRRVAADIGRKEKRVESVKALIVDLEKKVAILEGVEANPVVTPGEAEIAEVAAALIAEGATQEEAAAAAGKAVASASASASASAGGAPPVVVAPAAGAAAPAEVVVEEPVATFEGAAPEVAPKELNVIVADTMAQIKIKSVPLPKAEESSEDDDDEGEGGNFLGGKGPKPSFPGDGSEMVIG